MSQKLTIDQSFQKFLTNLNPTDRQRQRIQRTRSSIDSVLANDPRIHLNTQKQSSFLTGSYARNTIIRPLDDVDLYVRIHFGKHAENQSPLGILRLFRSALSKRYPNNTKINVDSPCVVVKFGGYKFEIVPAVAYDGDPDLYDVPAPGSKEWMSCYPEVPSSWLTSCNHANNQMFIPLIKILKQWNRHYSVRLKSFHLELLTEKVFGQITDIDSYPQGVLDWFYCVHDWIYNNDYAFIQEPGKHGTYVDDYLFGHRRRLFVVRKKLGSCLKKAERAWDYYLKGKPIAAKRIYNNLFGNMFPAPGSLPAKPAISPPKPALQPALRDIMPAPRPNGLLERATGLTLRDVMSYQKEKETNALSGGLLASHEPTLADLLRPKQDGNALFDALFQANNPLKKE